MIYFLYLNNNVEYDPMKEFLYINANRNYTKILFYPFIGCGFANKMPALTSSILLSILSYCSLSIVNWYQLLYYYQLPKFLFIPKYNLSNVKTFNKKNVQVIEDLKRGKSIRVYIYHSFTSTIFTFYNLSTKIKYYLQKNSLKYSNVDMFIQDVFLKPSQIIMNYIKEFNELKNGLFVIGVHIRTGYLTDFKENDKRFFNKNSLSNYVKRIENLLLTKHNSKLYIISDSSIVKRNLSEKFINSILNYSVPGNICHARYSMHENKGLNQCVVKLIAENLILSECNFIIGSRKSTYFGMASKRKKIKSISID